ncbi:MAG: tripartite tricarboxylate transporter substrate binding protein [Betaproteobacteria bacterium]|nr:tripartite tricarboxylate transporter substrate binding protein [Betaproteobacteria bacterium]
MRSLLALLGALLSASVLAQTFPAKPVRLIVAFGTGGVSDIMGRVLAQKMGETLGQPMVVENRAGAGGMIGTDFVAKAAPDGYVIVLSSPTQMAIVPNLNKSTPYDPVKDFTPIGGVAMTPNILSANVSAPFRNLKELVEYARANPGKLTFGSSGPGSVGHLSGEVLRTSSGAQLTHVPYKSAGAAYPDMISGNISMVFDTLPSAIQHIKSGKAHPIALMASKRAPLLPEVPTFAEAGFPEATLHFWIGLHGPAHIPQPVVQALNDGLKKALAAPDLRDRFTQLGADPLATTPQELGDMTRTTLEQITKTIKAAGIKGD